MESDKFKLGLFLLLTFVIACFLFVAFGLFDYGQKKVQIVTLFEESVQGLEVGSTVQLRGVPIGRVKDITISMKDKLIRVDMEINVDKVRMQALGGKVETEVTEENFYLMIKKEISMGLCAQIQMTGITGGKSIGFDYVSKDTKIKNYAKPGFNQDGVFYIPSRPSAFIDLRNRLFDTLEKVAAIDFKGISERTEKLLTSAEKLVANPELASAITNLDDLTDELNKTVSSLNKTLTPERIDALTKDTRDTLLATKKMVETLQQEIEKAKFDKTTESIRFAGDTIADNRRLIQDSLIRFSSALDRLNELLQMIDENPQSFINGKKE